LVLRIIIRISILFKSSEHNTKTHKTQYDLAAVKAKLAELEKDVDRAAQKLKGSMKKQV